MANETLLTLAADIISAHVSNNMVSTDSLPGLITSVYDSLAGLGQVPEPAEDVLTPAVSLRASVKPDAITCLECGKKFKMLKRHLSTDHQLTPEEYRKRWSLPADYPVVAKNYAEKRKELAVKIGLGHHATPRGKSKNGNQPSAETAASAPPSSAPKARASKASKTAPTAE